jgi:phytoene/squalene synthetase
MADNKLDQLLEKVHAEIENTEQVDEKGRELLQDLENDIRGLLDRSESAGGDTPAVQRLRDAISHFEVTHPTLTAMLSELSTILSNAGI